MTDKHCSAARFYDPGDYVGRHRLSKRWSYRRVDTNPGYETTNSFVLFKINLHGGAFQ